MKRDLVDELYIKRRINDIEKNIKQKFCIYTKFFRFTLV